MIHLFHKLCEKNYKVNREICPLGDSDNCYGKEEKAA